MKFHKQSIFYLMIFVFIMGIFSCLYNIFCVEFDNTIKTIYASLIIGLISSIGLFINLINNIETKEQTNRLIQENVNNRFIQLRFNDSKRAIHDLIIFLQSSVNVYYRIIDLYGHEKHDNSKVLSPRAFLIMQFINIISNTLLLNDLPYSLRKFIENKFEDKLKPTFDGSSMEMIDFMSNEVGSSFSALDLDEYKEFIYQFFEIKNQNQNVIFFKYYYESPEITEEELLNHFNDILNILSSYTVEELILWDENIEIEKIDYLSEYNKNRDNLHNNKGNN